MSHVFPFFPFSFSFEISGISNPIFPFEGQRYDTGSFEDLNQRTKLKSLK